MTPSAQISLRIFPTETFCRHGKELVATDAIVVGLLEVLIHTQMSDINGIIHLNKEITSSEISGNEIEYCQQSVLLCKATMKWQFVCHWWDQ